jgi:uncharacterized membrane protein
VPVTEFEVVPDEVDGWDVKRKGEEQALSNHATREAAEEAARLRAEHEEEEVRIAVRERELHRVDDETRGVKAAFLSLGGLLLFITLLIVVIALIGALTDFGA